MKSFILLLVAALALVLSASAVPTDGFFYGNPSSGTIQFAASTGAQDQFANTFVSRPSAIAYDPTSDQVLFSNTAPSGSPWVASAPVNGNSPADVVFSAPSLSPRGATVHAVELDASLDTLFVLYSEAIPTNRLKFNINSQYAAIQKFALAGDGKLEDVLMVNNGTQLPNSIALDAANQVVYLSANGMASMVHGPRVDGGLYKVGYDGKDFTLVLSIEALSEPGNFVASVQYAASTNALYYILHVGNATQIHRFDVATKEDTVVYDGSTFTPTQLVVVDEGDSVTLWVRNAVGDFYQCENENCLSVPTFSVSGGAAISDFDIDTDSNTFYAVGPRIPGVLTMNTASETSFLVSGVGKDTKIWVDSANSVLYYTGYNRIDSFALTVDQTWATTAALASPIDHFTGDMSSGLLIAASKAAGTITQVNPTTHESSEIISAVEAAAIAASAGTLYFSRATSQAGEFTIESCEILDCQPVQLVSGIPEAVTSITIGFSGNVYYATADGIFNALEIERPVVAPVATISPYSLVLYPELAAPTLFFLDVQGSTVDIASCELAACAATVKGFQTTVPAPHTGKQTNAFLTGNADASIFYWAAASAPQQVFKYDVAQRTSEFLLNTTGLIHGLQLVDDDTKLLIGAGGSVQVHAALDRNGAECIKGENVTVGAFVATPASLFWADKKTGNVFQCSSNCSDCWDSDLVNRGNPDCGEWQSLATSSNALYEEYGCGGIVRAQAESPIVHLKGHGKMPFSSLVAGNDGMLAWAVPFRNTIIQSTDGGDGLTGTTTLLTGTGVFTELVVDEASTDAMFYWIDRAAQKILYSSADGLVSDLTLQYAAGLAPYSATVEEPSPTSSPSSSPTAMASATATTSATPSMSPTLLESTSMGASESPSSSVTTLGSMSVSVSMTPSATGSMQANITTETATTSATPSATASWSVGASLEPESASPTPSPSITPEPSLIPGQSPSTTPTYSFNPYFVGSQSNTPGLAQSIGEEHSPLITKSGWEWVGLITGILIVCVLIHLYFTWRKGVEREMAMSLLLPDDN